MIPGIVAAGAMIATGGAPSPILVTEDQPLSVTTFLVDATGQSDGTGYATDDSFWANVLTYSGSAAILSEKFEFNGTTDYIQAPNKNIFGPIYKGTWELFAVEFDDVASEQTLVSFYHATSGGHSWRIQYDGPNSRLGLDATGSTSGTLSNIINYPWVPATDGTEYDIAFRWTGTEVAILIDGEVVATAAYSAGFGQANAVMRMGADDAASGGSPRNYFSGRYAAFRYTCEYDRTGGAADFYQRHALPLPVAWGTSLTEADDPTFSNVAFLTDFDGVDAATSCTDYAPSSPVTPTFVGNAQLDTAEKKFGTASLLLDGSGDIVTLGNKTEFQGTNGNDLVVEAWVWDNADDTGIHTILSKRPTSGTATEWQWGISNRRLSFTMWQGGSVLTGSLPNVPVPPNRWTYIAVKRIGTDLTTYVDGLLVGTGTQTGTVSTSGNSLDIGRDRDFGRYWNGWIDEMRIVRGEDYLPDTDFAPPTAAFPKS